MTYIKKWKNVFENVEGDVNYSATNMVDVSYNGNTLLSQQINNLPDLLLKKNKKGTYDLNRLDGETSTEEKKKFKLVDLFSDLNKTLIKLSKKPRIFGRIAKVAIKKSLGGLNGTYVVDREMVQKQNKKLKTEDLDLIFGDAEEVAKYGASNITINFKVTELKLDEQEWEKGDSKFDGYSMAKIYFVANIKIEHMLLDALDKDIGTVNNISGPISVKYSLVEDEEKKATHINWEIISIGINFEKQASQFKVKMNYT
jgi:rRNA processing protein Gar1